MRKWTYFDKSILVMLSLCFRYWDNMNMSSEYRPAFFKFNCYSWSVLMSCRGIRLPLMANYSTLCSNTNLARYFKLNSFILEFLKLISLGITLMLRDAGSSNLSLGKMGWPMIYLNVWGVYKMFSCNLESSSLTSWRVWNLCCWSRCSILTMIWQISFDKTKSLKK